MFSSCTVLPDSKKTELGSSDQEDCSLAGKKTGVVLVPCCAWKCVHTAYSYFWVRVFFIGPWMLFVMTDEFLVGFTKITARIGVSWTHILPFCF